MLEVRNLKKNYGALEALKGISFTVGEGEIYGLLGPNGAGKSTAIGIISGVLAPTAGNVTVCGRDMLDDPTGTKKLLGVVPQESLLIEELSALQNCLFFGSLYGVGKKELRERALDLLAWIGLSDRVDEPIGRYSGGMKKRLSLVLSIIHRPSILVLDEPTVGLDPQTRLMILDAVREIASEGSAVLFCTHYLDEAEKLCNRVGIIDRGEILKEGTLDELRRDVENVQIVTLRGSFSGCEATEAFSSIGGSRIVRQSEEEIVLSVPSAPGTTRSLFDLSAGLENVLEISVKPPSLESLFIALTGRDIRE